VKQDMSRPINQSAESATERNIHLKAQALRNALKAIADGTPLQQAALKKAFRLPQPSQGRSASPLCLGKVPH